MSDISTITVPNGSSYNIKDSVARQSINNLNGIYAVKGTQTENTASWTGNINVPALYDGLTIAYYLPRNSANNATLNLTLSDGTSKTGAINLYLINTTRIGTQYGAGSTIILTYWSAGSISINGTATTDNRWITADYYVNNSDTIPQAYCNTASATAGKTASCSGYTLTANTYLMVNIVNANTVASAITLNVNGKGAKPIYINGSASSSSNYSLAAGSYLTFYDGTNYYFRTDGKLTASITGDAATVGGHTVAKNVPSNALFTDNNTTYAAGTGVTITGTNNAINVSYGTTSGTACQGNDSRLSNSRPASDVYSWAKASSKPTYTASEVKAVSTEASQGLTDTEKANARANIGAGTSSFSGSYNDLSNKPTIPTLSDATNSTSSTVAASSKAVKTAYDLAASKTANTGTVTKVSTGIGLTGGDITTTGTVKAKLKTETARTIDALSADTSTAKLYPVVADKSGYLAVGVPWTDSDHITSATTSGSGNAVTAISANANGALTVTKGTTFLTSHQDISGKANLASPAFSGTPTAPTAANGTNNTQIATTAFVMNAFTANDAMVFKGTIGSSGATVTSLPATHYQGWTYKVITAGTYAGAACEIGDMIICITDGTSANDAHWTVVQSNIDGAVTGPASSVDARVAVFNGTSGKVIKDSGFTIAKSVPSNAVFTDTDTKVTAVGNHYTPTGSTTISASGGTATNATGSGSAQQVVTGVTVDAKGHVTAVTSKGIYSTDNNTDTKVTSVSNHYTPSGGTTTSASGGTATNATGSGSAQQVVTGVTIDAAGHVTGVTSKGIYSTDTNTWRPVGTGASDAAAGNHTHSTSIATSSGTNQLTLAANTKYAITAGGTSYVFTTPPDTNTWRGISDAVDSTSSDVSASSKAVKTAYDLANGKANASHTHNYAGSSSAGGAANSLANFKVTTTSNNAIDTPGSNAIAYASGLTKANWNYQQTDGGYYCQWYSASWWHEIFGDYRTGQISVRGNNNGTKTDWRRVLDETNYTSIISLGSCSGLTKSQVTTALGYTPPTSDTNTHRPIQVNGTEVLGNNTTALNLKAGTNVSITNSSGTVTITATDTNTWRSISDAVNSTSSDVSASSKAVKTAYDLAASKTANTGTVTQVSAGTGLTGGNITTSGTIALATSGVTAGSAGPTAAVTGSNNTTVAIPRITVDAYGRVTALTSYNLTNVNTDTDTKNTAGSTDTSSKIFLVGATSQAANPQTYSDNEVYATNGVLTTKSMQVGGGAATIQYNATTKSIDFVFA